MYIKYIYIFIYALHIKKSLAGGKEIESAVYVERANVISTSVKKGHREKG